MNLKPKESWSSPSQKHSNHNEGKTQPANRSEPEFRSKIPALLIYPSFLAGSLAAHKVHSHLSEQPQKMAPNSLNWWGFGSARSSRQSAGLSTVGRITVASGCCFRTEALDRKTSVPPVWNTSLASCTDLLSLGHGPNIVPLLKVDEANADGPGRESSSRED